MLQHLILRLRLRALSFEEVSKEGVYVILRLLQLLCRHESIKSIGIKERKRTKVKRLVELKGGKVGVRVHFHDDKV